METMEKKALNEECDGKCGSSSKADERTVPRKQAYEEEERKRKARMSKIKHKIAVISGKGGVGKSTVTVNLAMAFAMHGHAYSVGIFDADITGPCVPKIMGVKGQRLQAGPAGVFPAMGPLGIKVVSMDFLLPSDDAPVIWRGPLKMRAISEFLSDIVWGELEFLFIDLPPGTGDEPLSVMQLIPEMDGVVIVTIPSEVSQIVVKKAVTFARQLNVPVIGIVENMSGFVCPKCGSEIDIFKIGGGKKIAEDLSIPFLGSIPIDPEICRDSDKGMPFIIEHSSSPATKAFMEIVKKIENFLKNAKRLERPPRVSSQE
ncbi:MAG: Mrp/NBP35 family ATP-binding protein [Candidatus Bathyarchaeota archaeon]|nr:Mrp/NBP35 family ATP-binding protein [Candidatus Bathyarchaeota archaeon]